MIKNLTLILLLLLLIVITKLQGKPIDNQCKDPTLEELKDLLSKEYKNILNKIQEGIEIYPPVQEKYNITAKTILNFSSSSFSIIELGKKHGKQDCNKNDQTIWHTNEISICPYHFVEIKRKNRFPHLLKQAVCNCKQCIDVKMSKCLPLNVAKPALERDYCSLNDGVFKWKFIMEFVAVGCSCKQLLELD